jgi:hypothetical protein
MIHSIAGVAPVTSERVERKLTTTSRLILPTIAGRPVWTRKGGCVAFVRSAPIGSIDDTNWFHGAPNVLRDLLKHDLEGGTRVR